jgi:hypothetical protein
MNRNPPIMRLRLHWLRYDLVVPPSQPRACTTPHHPRPGLVSSMPYTCAHECSRVHRVNVTYTLRTPTLYLRGAHKAFATRDCRRETNCLSDGEHAPMPFTGAARRSFSLARERTGRVAARLLLENSTLRISFFFFFLFPFFPFSFWTSRGRFFSCHADLGLVNI